MAHTIDLDLADDFLTSSLQDATESICEFIGVGDQPLDPILDLMEPVQYAAGEVVVHEGDAADEMFFIASGTLEATTSSPEDASITLTLSVMKPGVWFGEIGLLHGQERSASVTALEESTLFVIRRDDVEELRYEQPTLYGTLIANISSELASRMRQNNQVLLQKHRTVTESAKLRSAMGNFFSLALMILCGYSLLIKVGQELIDNASATSMITSPIMLICAGSLLWLMKTSGYPLASYGLTLRGWRKDIPQAIWWTIPFLLVMVAVKWIGIRGLFPDAPLFVFGEVLSGNFIPGKQTPIWVPLVFGLVYSITVPIQELITRGALQSVLQRFLTGKNAVWMAILLANTTFATVHLHLSLKFAIAAFIPGLLWGWIYSRQGTLVGVCASHVLIGNFAFYVLGIRELI